MSQSNPTFAELIADCHESAVHLETRDVYAVTEEDEDFVAWRAGRSYDLADREAWWTAFHQTVFDAVARGVVFRRARIVSEPVTDYIRYEHACTPQNIMAGGCLVVQLIAAGHTAEAAEGWVSRCSAWTSAVPRAIDAFALANLRMHATSLNRIRKCPG